MAHHKMNDTSQNLTLPLISSRYCFAQAGSIAAILHPAMGHKGRLDLKVCCTLRSFQQLPSFAVFVEAASAAAMRRDAETDDGIEGLDGNNVPSFVRNDIGGQEINIGGGIAAFYPAAGGSGDAVGSAIDNRDRFHLHPQEAGASIHDEIVAGIVAEG